MGYGFPWRTEWARKMRVGESPSASCSWLGRTTPLRPSCGVYSDARYRPREGRAKSLSQECALASPASRWSWTPMRRRNLVRFREGLWMHMTREVRRCSSWLVASCIRESPNWRWNSLDPQLPCNLHAPRLKVPGSAQARGPWPSTSQ